MKILIEGGDLNPPFIEGTRNIARTHWEELIKRGHEVIVLTRRKETNTGKVFPKIQIMNGVKHYRWSNYLDLFSSLLKIRKEKVDVVHIFAKSLRPSVYLKILKRILRKRIIFSLLGYPFHNGYKQKDFELFLREINCLAVSSKTVSNALKKISNSSKINYLSYGINSYKFSPARKNKKITKIVCLKFPEKALIEAFEEVSSESKNLELILDKKLSKEKNMFFLPNPHVKYVGFLSDISKLLNVSDILVELHSQKDFLDCASPPLLLLEAMASGMKIVSTDIPEISEVIKNNKEAILIKNNNKTELYNALRNLIKKHNLYGENARKKALKDHNIKDIVTIYEKKLYALS